MHYLKWALLLRVCWAKSTNKAQTEIEHHPAVLTFETNLNPFYRLGSDRNLWALSRRKAFIFINNIAYWNFYSISIFAHFTKIPKKSRLFFCLSKKTDFFGMYFISQSFPRVKENEIIHVRVLAQVLLQIDCQKTSFPCNLYFFILLILSQFFSPPLFIFERPCCCFYCCCCCQEMVMACPNQEISTTQASHQAPLFEREFVRSLRNQCPNCRRWWGTEEHLCAWVGTMRWYIGGQWYRANPKSSNLSGERGKQRKLKGNRKERGVARMGGNRMHDNAPRKIKLKPLKNESTKGRGRIREGKEFFKKSSFQCQWTVR